jgi:hypothetical protein
MGAPVALTVQTPNVGAKNSMLPVFFRAQWPLQTDWERESTVSIKRAGIFCNFADGLVQKMDASRVVMTITAAIYAPDTVLPAPELVAFTVDDNEATITDMAAPGPYGAGRVIVDLADGQLIPYFIQSVGAPAVDSPLYLTDYAFKGSAKQPVYFYNVVTLDTYVQQRTFTINNIATLNTMYEAEIYFPFAPRAANQRLFLSCQLGVDGEADSLDFFTNIVDPSFNGSAISFDSVIEVEITPYQPPYAPPPPPAP